MLRSLRWRLQAWYAVILLAVIAGFGATLHSVVRKGRFEEIDAELHAAARSLEGSLRTLPPRILREGFDLRPHAVFIAIETPQRISGIGRAHFLVFLL